jgi:hypothetical protein
MMAMTTRSSIKVKALRLQAVWTPKEPLLATRHLSRELVLRFIGGFCHKAVLPEYPHY